ncbi:hypothetical protein SMA08_33075, partial [Klebsiella pneumoniae]
VEYTNSSIKSTDNVEFKFEVINTGKDAKEKNKEGREYGNHESMVKANKLGGKYTASHWEETKYKGLHHMFISVYINGQQYTEKKKFSLFIA